MLNPAASEAGALSPTESRSESYGSLAYRVYVLFILLLVYMFTSLDRAILLVLIEPIKNELGLSDSQMGVIAGPAFSITYVLVAIPLGLLADRVSRRNVIAVCVGFWSLMTAFCGLAGSYVQMIFARMGVGMGEAGGAPSSMAIISDIFPASRRATALAIFYVGGSLGGVLAFGGGAWVASHYGWRTAFLAAGIPGMLLALLIYFTVREPIRGTSDGLQHQAAAPTPVKETLKFIVHQRSVVHILSGLVFQHAVGHGLMAFFASFGMRSHGMSLTEIGVLISGVYLVASTLTKLIAGVTADYLGQRDERWRIRLGVLGAGLAALSIPMMMFSGSKPLLIAFFILWVISSSITQAPLYALLQTLVKPQMRATIGSVQFVVGSAIGGALGPLFVGVASDLLAPRFGTDSLRYAIFIVGLFYLWAATHFALGERSLRADIERARQI